jgi:hypothetical protein
MNKVSDLELEHAFVGCVTPELCSVTVIPSPPTDPDLQQLLAEYKDVLVSSIPGG